MFAESISGSQFVSRACDGWQNFINGWCDGNPTAIMGEHVDTRCQLTVCLLIALISPSTLLNLLITNILTTPTAMHFFLNLSLVSSEVMGLLKKELY